jgi:hypothetical protein
MNCLTGVWHISPDAFVDAIRDHLNSGGRVFRKKERGGNRLLPNKVDASVWIREPDEDDDYDDGTVYVEFTITETEVVLICDAHNHENRGRDPRLPF